MKATDAKVNTSAHASPTVNLIAIAEPRITKNQIAADVIVMPFTTSFKKRNEPVLPGAICA